MGRLAGHQAGRSQDLVGREAEQARAEAFAAASPDGARALLIRGEPGIGKTALWRDAVERCDTAGCTVLLTRAAEEEMALGFAGLVDLFDHVDVETDALIEEDNPFARGRAVLTALRGLAELGPTVIAIDDLQWLDVPSARALRFALRRLDGEPIGLLATVRLAPDPLDVAATLPPGRCDTVDVGPLGLAALRRVLDGVVESISRPALERIHRVSAGNPLYAIELARGLVTGERPPRPPGLRLPASLQSAIARRLASVTGELYPLLETASALGPTTVAELRDAIPALDVDTLLPCAERQGLLVVEDDLRVRFSHPLIGSVVYEQMSPLTRRALHASLAAASADEDVRARHLAFSTDSPSAPVAQLLEDAAARARTRGAYDLAADFAGHGARLTPSEDGDARLRRAVQEIEDRGAAGELSRALALADRLIETLPRGRERAAALLLRACWEDDHLEVGARRLRQALDEAGDDGPLRARALDQLSWALGMFGRDLEAALGHGREAVAIGERLDDEPLRMSLVGQLAYLEGLAGAPRPDRMAEALRLEATIGRPILWTSPRTLMAEHLLWDGDLDAAHEWFEDVRADAVRSGLEVHLPYCLFDLAVVACAAGEFRAAAELVREGTVAARDAEDTWGERLLLYPHALVETWLGRADAAREIARRRLTEAEEKEERPGIVRARATLGLLALSEGDDATAARELSEAAALLDAMGFRHPGAFPVLPDAVEALACAGDMAAAERLLDRLRTDAEAARSGWARAAAERSHGALLLACGDAEAALPPLARALAAFDRTGHRPDAARTLFLRGRAQLRAGQRTHAADALADAGRRFAAMGAALWGERVATELERAAPGRATGELTPAERRIAELVAQGKRNREIGAALFMSVGTVEAHLTRTYRKLGIRSRSELAGRIADGSI